MKKYTGINAYFTFTAGSISFAPVVKEGLNHLPAA
jgi:hypothetical protein